VVVHGERFCRRVFRRGETHHELHPKMTGESGRPAASQAFWRRKSLSAETWSSRAPKCGPFGGIQRFVCRCQSRTLNGMRELRLLSLAPWPWCTMVPTVQAIRSFCRQREVGPKGFEREGFKEAIQIIREGYSGLREIRRRSCNYSFSATC